jgi:hypothetical protein
VAFQLLVMTCPLGSVNTSDQPLTVVLPVLAMMMFVVKPVGHVLWKL